MSKICFVSADEAVKIVQSGNRVYVQAGAAAPTILTEALTRRSAQLRNVEICQILTEGPAHYADPKYSESFFVNAFFISKNIRQAVQSENGTYTPVFLSDLPGLFDRGVLPIDVVFIHVSLPDEHGYCTLGVSVEATKAAIRNAKYVVAQVNEQMPRVFGDGVIHISEIDYAVAHNSPIYTANLPEATEIEQKIGNYIAALIEDGSTIQMGVGSIPNAVLSNLVHLKDLGVHTELLTDGVINLVEKGVITGKNKKVNKGKIVSTFMMGSQRLYDFVNNNPMVEQREASYTNDTAIIRQNPKMIAINSAIEVDVTGQVCADSIGPNMYSGVGGQLDFVRGASLSVGGKAIIALPSLTKHGHSRIVPFLKQGAGVVTTRSHVQYIVTEYGVAHLFGKTLKDRVKSMINIAHPEHRESIEKTYYDTIRK